MLLKNGRSYCENKKYYKQTAAVNDFHGGCLLCKTVFLYLSTGNKKILYAEGAPAKSWQQAGASWARLQASSKGEVWLFAERRNDRAVRKIPSHSAGDFEWSAVHSDVVEIRGFEPLTFCMRSRRAPNCAIPPNSKSQNVCDKLYHFLFGLSSIFLKKIILFLSNFYRKISA